MPFWGYIIIGVVVALLLGGVIASFIIVNPIAQRIFDKQWIRKDDEMFKRGCSDETVDFHLDMYNQGMKYRETVLDHIKEVKILSEGLKMVGEYYDFGFKKAIIILPGRAETCYYGAYYAPTFIKAGYNILCIDPRAHGLSEGKVLTLGFKESLDTIEWSKFLHKEFGIEHVCLYGLCGGGTCACLTFLNKDCPSYVDSFIADCAYYSFFEVNKRHIKDEGKPIYPFIWLMMHKIKKYCHVSGYKAAPIKYIKDVKVPTLFLAGENDIFSIPTKVEKLYKRSGSEKKSFALISHARHSHLRYDNLEEYEKNVISFLESN